MKKIALAIAVLTVTALSLPAKGIKDIYDKYSSKAEVSCIYISPKMFSMMKELPEVEIKDEDVDFSRVIRKLRGFYIINSENEVVNASLNADIISLITSGEMELLMEVRDESEKMKIYITQAGDIVTNIVMHASEADEESIIWIDGDIPEKELMALFSQGNI